MTWLAVRLRPRHTSWPTLLVVAGVAALGVSFGLFATGLVPLLVTTVGAVAGGTAFLLGVSASISAFFERESYADSDFYR